MGCVERAEAHRNGDGEERGLPQHAPVVPGVPGAREDERSADCRDEDRALQRDHAGDREGQPRECRSRRPSWTAGLGQQQPQRSENEERAERVEAEARAVVEYIGE